MDKIQWNQQMELGIPAIDHAHQEFIKELNRIVGTSDEEFPAHMKQLIAQIEQDFAAEEKLMEQIDFPALNSHREQHARVLGGLHHAISRVMSGDLQCGREAAGLLFDWFQIHVATMDAALAVAADTAAVERAFPGT